MWMFLHFTNCLFASGKATLLIFVIFHFTRRANHQKNYLTHAVNFACQLKQEYPEKPTMFSKSLARKYSFHMNMVQITPRLQSNHTQRTVLGSYFIGSFQVNCRVNLKLNGSEQKIMVLYNWQIYCSKIHRIFLQTNTKTNCRFDLNCSFYFHNQT